MSKKSFMLAVICGLLLIMATPTMAVLKVLDPAISEELRAIAVKHLAETHNTDAIAIAIEDGWLREFWNAKVEVYMVEAVIDRGLASEQKVQVPVRVDQKTVLTADELKALEAEDNRLAPEDPQARILMTENAPTAEPVRATDTDLAADPSNTIYFGIALVSAALIGALAILRMRRKA
ncbi:MAG: hypothetical protein KGZ54_05845 [Dethiobacter sp.]|nr:hypothetical protein [Dethiobacter sp.]MBS3901523.1 hypothetical protein [Dethiobacter sp.]MBS3989553.1 hypothetical protein [Dethiobacter sp.]